MAEGEATTSQMNQTNGAKSLLLCEGAAETVHGQGHAARHRPAV